MTLSLGDLYLLSSPSPSDIQAILGVAVSGGGDSMALLDLMAHHGADQGFQVRAITVDHGLRPEARAEAEFVAAHCATRGIPHETYGWKTFDGTGNLQARARRARYDIIADWARRKGIGTVALGHTKDDVAETFLMRLARASGVDGLSEMDRRFERNGVTWIRPLLAMPRDECREHLRAQGIGWVDDPTNEEEQFERVRARKVLEALMPLDIDTDTLATVAQNMRFARSALDHFVRITADRYVVEDRGDLIIPAEMPETGHQIPSEILFRLRRTAIRWVSGADYPPRSAAMTELDSALLAGASHTLGGCLFTNVPAQKPNTHRCRVSREWNAVKALRTPTTVIWDRWVLDGPHAEGLEIRALGEALNDCPDWRDTSLPRASLFASPAVFDGNALISAPLAGVSNGWSAELAPNRADFAAFLLRH